MKKRKRKRANKMNYALIVVNSKSLEISDDNLVNICNFLEAAPGFSSMLNLSYEAMGST